MNICILKKGSEEVEALKPKFCWPSTLIALSILGIPSPDNTKLAKKRLKSVR